MSTQLEPRIYAACLAAYNNGHLHGAWIDATQPLDDMYEALQSMLRSSPMANAEEWAIHAYEDFGDTSISEHQSIESVSELATFITEHGELGAAVLCYVGNDIADATRLLEDNYHGEHKSEKDFAQQLYEDCYEIPDHLVYYIDYQAIARDLFCSDYFSLDAGNKKHIFSCH